MMRDFSPSAPRAPKGQAVSSRVYQDDLQDLLDDPLTHVIMKHDGVSREALLELIAQQQERLRQRSAAMRRQ